MVVDVVVVGKQASDLCKVRMEDIVPKSTGPGSGGMRETDNTYKQYETRVKTNGQTFWIRISVRPTNS